MEQRQPVALDGRSDAQPGSDEEWLGLPEAAVRLGIAIDTLRRKVKRGQIHSRQTPIQGGYRWEVCVASDSGPAVRAPAASPIAPEPTPSFDDPPLPDSIGSIGSPPYASSIGSIGSIGAPSAPLPAGPDLTALVALLREAQMEIKRLSDERLEMAGRLGYFQAELDHARATILQLQAPAAEPQGPPPTESGTTTPEPETIPSPSAAASGPEDRPRPWWRWW